MSPMSDQPLTLGVLAQFHREVILPDVQRIVHEAVSASERRLQGHIDAILHKLDKLETEYEFLKIGVGRVETQVVALEASYRDLLAAVNRLEERQSRVEERLGRVEGQVDALAGAKEKDPLRAEVADLRTRVDSLQAQVRTLEKRFDQ